MSAPKRPSTSTKSVDGSESIPNTPTVIRKKVQKTPSNPHTDDVKAKADSVVKEASSPIRKKTPKQVTDQIPKTPTTDHTSRAGSIASGTQPPEVQSPTSTTKKMIKKKKPSLQPVEDNEALDKAQGQVESVKKNKPKPPVGQLAEKPEQLDQTQEKVNSIKKKKLKVPAADAPNVETPAQVDEVKKSVEKQKPDAPDVTSSAPGTDNLPSTKSLKRKVKKAVTPPPELEPEMQEVDPHPEEDEESVNNDQHPGIDMQSNEGEDFNEDHSEEHSDENEEHDDEDQVESQEGSVDEQEYEDEEEDEEEDDNGSPTNLTGDLPSEGQESLTKAAKETAGSVGNKPQEIGKSGVDKVKGLVGSVPGADSVPQNDTGNDATNASRNVAENASGLLGGGKNTAEGLLGGVTDKANKSTKNATDKASNAAETASTKAKGATSNLPASDAVNGVSDQAGGLADKTKGLASDTTDDLPGIADEVVAEPESVFSEDATKSATDLASGGLNQGKDLDGGSLEKAQGTTDDLPKQGQDAVGGLADQAGSLKGNFGQTVNNTDEKLRKATGDVEKGFGDAGSGVLTKGFTPESRGSGSVNAGGIQISVQTTKDGMSLTINIPGSFQQQ